MTAEFLDQVDAQLAIEAGGTIRAVETLVRPLLENHRERLLESGSSTTESGTRFGLAIVDRIAQVRSRALTASEGSADGAGFEFGDVERLE